MDIRDQHILLIGAGNMGSALLHAWLDSDIAKQNITILEKNISISGHTIVSTADEVTATPTVIVLAVKPQSMDGVLPSVVAKFGTTPLYISIAAGKPLDYFASHLGDAPVVRAMPNTPAMIRKGITALCANAYVSKVQKEIAHTLLAAAGEVVWLEDESLMDVVTAISGSGPAYVFLFIDALTQAGIANGLPADVSRTLATQTVLGSAALAQHNTIIPLDELRQKVTSKGGTTEAALTILMQDDALKTLMAKAVDAAIKRSKELA